jgi:predicted CoA-binding protein
MMISDFEVKRILIETKVIAVVGCSRNPEKDAHIVPKYLKEHGYRIIPVNPFADEVLGYKSYESLSEIDEPVDVVEVFRPSDEVLEVVKEAIKLKPKAIWMQLGIINEEAAALAKENGIKVIMNRCMMTEHKRWFVNEA